MLKWKLDDPINKTYQWQKINRTTDYLSNEYSGSETSYKIKRWVYQQAEKAYYPFSSILFRKLSSDCLEISR